MRGLGDNNNHCAAFEISKREWRRFSLFTFQREKETEGESVNEEENEAVALFYLLTMKLKKITGIFWKFKKKKGKRKMRKCF